MSTLAVCAGVASASGTMAAAGAGVEYNPMVTRQVAIGPLANRLIVGFRALPDTVPVETVRSRVNGPTVKISQARTAAGDVAALTQRAALGIAGSRQLTPSMHVLFLQKTLYGPAVDAVLHTLRADPAILFADVDQRRYPNTVPDDPLFAAAPTAAGQWYMMMPGATGDSAATDAASAWNITTGSTGIIIADVDTGVRFEHPDLLRAGFGGRLLPGYDFVSQDYNPTSGVALGTYLIANDGDGWDPDPSDPGDWISSADQSNAVLFPAANCGLADSSWHGTRVMGILGAITNNGTGIAGMTWNSYLLPVRALGKCGGYDSDIVTGMQWAAGMPVSGVPNNPYPANLINLSLGASGTCPSAYAVAIPDLLKLGVLVVVSAGNASGPVDAPGNCPGVLAVAGLRNIGTKVGYSSLGAEIGIAAPAGNCVNSSGACLKTIDTTSNTGLTGPAADIYTSESNPNLGTSFSAPIVSGIAALMRAVNANLTPAQVIARMKSSAVAFPQPAGLPVCPSVSSDGSGECACPSDGTQCGAGMANAAAAVVAAQRPIAAVLVPVAGAGASSTLLDAGGSAASCGRSIASYAWTSSSGVSLSLPMNEPQVTVLPAGRAGTVTLTVTDSSAAVDTATLSVSTGGVVTAAPTTPATAGSSEGACPTPVSFSVAAPGVSEAFTPASVGVNGVSTLTITLSNSNKFDLTQSSLTQSLPASLVLRAPGTTCLPAGSAFAAAANTVTLSLAVIPALGSCEITIPMQSATPGSYVSSVAANALTTGPAGGNVDASTATLTVTAPGKGGGGALDWWDTMFVVGVLLAGRRHSKRKPPR